jgi:hypothetical protein
MKVLSIVVLCALAGQVHAEENHTGFYFGVGAGQISVEIPDFFPGVLPPFDESANAWKGFAGWNFSDNFALEAAFIDGDSVDQNFGSGVRATVDGEVLQLSAIGTYWFNDYLEIHGRASADMYDSRTELKVGDLLLGASNDKGTELGFGGGIGAVWDRALLRVDYEQADLEDSETRLVTLSIAWRL